MATPPMLDQRHSALERPRPDPVAAISIVLIGITATALVLGGILAIYDWRTPAAVKPLFFAGLSVFGASLAILVLGSAIRWARAGRPR